MLFPHSLLVFERPGDASRASRLLLSQLDFCTERACECREVALRSVELELEPDFSPAELSTERLHALFADRSMNSRLEVDRGVLEPDDYEGRSPLSPDWVDFLNSQIDQELLELLRERWLRAKSRSTDADRSLPGVRADRIGRNDPCPCGSGQKFKRCCINAESPST